MMHGSFSWRFGVGWHFLGAAFTPLLVQVVEAFWAFTIVSVDTFPFSYVQYYRHSARSLFPRAGCNPDKSFGITETRQITPHTEMVL
jgi:hypothetical protein